MERYRQLPAEAFEQRLMTISVVGELQRADAMPMLQDVVWAPLPEESSMPEGLSPRDIQEMIQANAVQGLCFLRSAKGYKAVMDVILNHESLHVRIEAIDAYMWNQARRNTLILDVLYPSLTDQLNPKRRSMSRSGSTINL